jgi:eukaryotic-like serine/threonine-protein kinase
MTPEQWREIRAKLQDVLEREPALRSAYLKEIVGAHPDLGREVESLVSSYDDMSADFLSSTAFSTGTELGSEVLRDSFIGRRLGPYQVVEHIGMGGMGEVFRASRADNLYQKQVAIKLVRAGHDSEFVVSRFKHERQILARLDHANIAACSTAARREKACRIL